MHLRTYQTLNVLFENLVVTRSPHHKNHGHCTLKDIEPLFSLRPLATHIEYSDIV